jgi:hypothetical protein
MLMTLNKSRQTLGRLQPPSAGPHAGRQTVLSHPMQYDPPAEQLPGGSPTQCKPAAQSAVTWHFEPSLPPPQPWHAVKVRTDPHAITHRVDTTPILTHCSAGHQTGQWQRRLLWQHCGVKIEATAKTEQRFEAAWQCVLDFAALKGLSPTELRLQRTVVRVQRTRELEKK